MDREHERDVFQQEIQKLEEQLRNPQKLQGASDPRGKEVTAAREHTESTSWGGGGGVWLVWGPWWFVKVHCRS